MECQPEVGYPGVVWQGRPPDFRRRVPKYWFLLRRFEPDGRSRVLGRAAGVRATLNDKKCAGNRGADVILADASKGTRCPGGYCREHEIPRVLVSRSRLRLIADGYR